MDAPEADSRGNDPPEWLNNGHAVTFGEPEGRRA